MISNLTKKHKEKIEAIIATKNSEHEIAMKKIMDENVTKIKKITNDSNKKLNDKFMEMDVGMKSISDDNQKIKATVVANTEAIKTIQESSKLTHNLLDGTVTDMLKCQLNVNLGSELKKSLLETLMANKDIIHRAPIAAEVVRNGASSVESTNNTGDLSKSTSADLKSSITCITSSLVSPKPTMIPDLVKTFLLNAFAFLSNSNEAK